MDRITPFVILLDVEVPDIGSPVMINLITVMINNLSKLEKFVLTNTQET